MGWGAWGAWGGWGGVDGVGWMGWGVGVLLIVSRNKHKHQLFQIVDYNKEFKKGFFKLLDYN